jgi:hypothetical protein
MGKKHANRIINVRCNYTDTSTTPPTIYKAGKYSYKYPSDDKRQSLIDKAIAEYKSDNALPAAAAVTYSYSTQDTG